MIPVVGHEPEQPLLAAEDERHILLVMKDPDEREAVSNQLQAAGFRVTSTGTYGIVETLLEHSKKIDLLVTAQSFGEMGQFGLPQLARSAQPDLPILVLEFEAARGDGVLKATRDAIRRWPLRDRPARLVH